MATSRLRGIPASPLPATKPDHAHNRPVPSGISAMSNPTLAAKLDLNAGPQATRTREQLASTRGRSLGQSRDYEGCGRQAKDARCRGELRDVGQNLKQHAYDLDKL